MFALIAVLLAAACTPRSGEPPVTMPATASGLAIAPDFSGTIWAATGKRVYRSHDGGHSWHVVPGEGGATGVAFLSTRVVAVGRRGVQTGGFGAANLRVRAASLRLSWPSPRRTTAPTGCTRSTRRAALGLGAERGPVGAAARGRPPRPEPSRSRRSAATSTSPTRSTSPAAPHGLWRSHDFGATFQRIPEAGQATAVAATTDDQRLLLVASPGGIELSRDRGRTFIQASSVGDVRAIAFDLRNWRLAYASTSGGRLLRSDDGGRTWTTG